jgi:hypothetical protein
MRFRFMRIDFHQASAAHETLLAQQAQEKGRAGRAALENRASYRVAEAFGLTKCAEVGCALYRLVRLRVFDEDPPSSFGMKKADQSRQPRSRLLVDELKPFSLGSQQFGCHVCGFEANVMQSAAVAGQKPAHAIFGHEWFQQLKLAFPNSQQDGLNPLVLDDGSFQQG